MHLYALSLTFLEGSQLCDPQECETFVPQCRCSPELPEDAETKNGETKGETALCRGRRDQGGVWAQALLVALDFPLLFLLLPPLLLWYPPLRWAAAAAAVAVYAPFILALRCLPDRNKCAHTHTSRCSVRPPPRQQLYAEGEKLEPFEQRGKRWQADGSSAPHSNREKQGGEGEGGGVSERERERGGGDKEERGVLYMTIIRFLHKPQMLIRVSVN